MKKSEPGLRDRTKTFALRIIRLFSELPPTTAAQILGRQLLRSGTSVGANYREAYRGRNRLLEIELFAESNIVTPQQLEALPQECNQLIAIFVTIIKRTRSSST